MRAPAVSFAQKIAAVALAALLTFTLVPLAHADGTSEGDTESVASGLPDQSNASADSFGELQEVSAEQDAEGSPVAPMLASGLAGKPNSFVNSDVALDSEPVIGSFTVDGLTFAVIDESHVELVGVAPAVILSEGSEAAGPSVTLSGAAEGGVVEGPNSNQASEAGLANLALPESVAYEGTTYTLTSIAPYAFYLSGVTDVTLPASVNDVDDRAFRSSDVANVEVAEGNPTYSSFDGALYDADQLSLLLIPEGKQGTVRIPKTAEVVEASVFSHCPLVDSISVDAGSAAFASENGLLYTSDLTTLLRIPAGATEITIREGCTTIAAGALEACANLTTINAPATVTSISPDVFHAIPTVSLPAASLAEDAPQLTAMVALSSTDEGLSVIDPSAILVILGKGSVVSDWERLGFTLNMPDDQGGLSFEQYSHYYANEGMTFVANGGAFTNVEFESTLRFIFFTNMNIRANASYVYASSWVISGDEARGYFYMTPPSGCTFLHWAQTASSTQGSPELILFNIESLPSTSYYAIWNVPLAWNPNGGFWDDNVSDKANKTSTHTSNAEVNGYDGSKCPSRVGYTFAGWKSSATGKLYSAASVVPVVYADTYTAQWKANPYTIAFDSQGGPEVASISATYDQDVTLPTPGARNGYRFTGWNTEADGSGTAYQAGVVLAKPNLATSGTATLFAQWDATISALVPLEVEAQVDVLGLEAPKEATGYIESRCGEPLKVARVDLTPLDGATELFGAGNVADVFLEVLASNGTSPNARFSLGASATESDASKLSAFTMGSYGTKVPIGYRFVMAPEVQTSLVESSTAKPVCSVAYTVALAGS